MLQLYPDQPSDNRHRHETVRFLAWLLLQHMLQCLWFRLQPITVSPSIDPFSLPSTASPSIDRQYPVLVVKVLINNYYCHSSITTTIASPGIDHHL